MYKEEWVFGEKNNNNEEKKYKINIWISLIIVRIWFNSEVKWKIKTL